MFKNYFKIALRNILKNKLYSFMNTMGLAIGIAACTIIALYVINEESYDSFNKNADRIVRATMTFSIRGATQNVAITGTKVLPAFKSTFPEVENGARMYNTSAIVKYNDKIFEEMKFTYADSSFFKIFSFNLMEGNPVIALAKPFNVILTVSMAKKYFGNEDPVGKVIKINSRGINRNNWKEYIVSGVMQDCPSNSQIKFDFLASFCSLPMAKPGTEKWFQAEYFTYLLLRTSKSIAALQAKIPDYMKLQKNEIGLRGNDWMTIQLEQLRRVHLYSEAQGGFEPAGDYRNVLIFSLIALLILGIACANFINITTAKATERAKEVGVRKVIGARRLQLFYQFIAESLVTVFIAFIIGLMLVEFIIPVFKNLYDMNLELSSLLSLNIAIAYCIIILFVSLLGGGYPAFILSGFQSIRVLKGNFKNSASGVWIRKGLIVFQFVISVSMIICTIVISRQLNYINNKKLGFEKNSVAVLSIDETMLGNLGVIKDELLKNSAIKGITTATRTPLFITSMGTVNYDNKEILFNQIGVDPDFLKTLDVQLIAGNNFTYSDTLNAIPNKSNAPSPIIINETALGQLNLTSDKAISKRVLFNGTSCIIKGVVKDFHFNSMHIKISPLVIYLKGYLNVMMVKISTEGLNNTIKYMKEKWDALATDHPFNLTFLNENFNKLYKSETRVVKIFYIFCILAVILAYLGLFGLVSFSVQQRTKEIGIRKTLGAKASNIISLLSKDYVKLMILANIIACPLASYYADKWLEGFAYRTDISVWMFIIIMFLSSILVLIMIGLQSMKAITANPVKSLKYE